MMLSVSLKLGLGKNCAVINLLDVLQARRLTEQIGLLTNFSILQFYGVIF